MDLASAAKLVSALNAQRARRGRNRDAAEEAKWREEGDAAYVFARIVDRLATQLDKPSAGPPPQRYVAMSDDDRPWVAKQGLAFLTIGGAVTFLNGC